MKKKIAQKCSEGNSNPLSEIENSPAHSNLKGVKSRCWIWTLNNYTDDELEFFHKLDISKIVKWTYCTFGKEVAPTTGTPHLQGMIYYTNQTVFSTVKKFLPKRCHIIKAKGSPTQCMTYCHKDGDVWELGKQPKQGQRADLNQIKNKILTTDYSARDLLVDDPIKIHQYGRTIDKIEDLKLTRKWRTEMTTCEWIYGTTGVGKSHYAFTSYHPNTHYVWANDKGWHCRYTQQDNVIINDFKGDIPYKDLLTLIDKWPESLPRRGKGPIPFITKHIVITSSRTPAEIYRQQVCKPEGLTELMRRIKLKQIHNKGEQPLELTKEQINNNEDSVKLKFNKLYEHVEVIDDDDIEVTFI